MLMYLKLILPIFLFWIYSCQSHKSEGKNKSTVKAEFQAIQVDTIATLIDSVNVGNKRKNKVCALLLQAKDSVPQIQLLFYAKDKQGWKLSFSFKEDYWHPSQLFKLQFFDFNSDGYKDILYSKGTGVRGGNSIRSMFIYDNKGDSLVYIINSDDYPNLHYNKKTNSINSIILTGSTETFFMRLCENELKPFAKILQEGQKIVVYELGKTGKDSIILVDSTTKYGEIELFNNYKPLTVQNRALY